VVKDAGLREELRRALKIICVEMEAAGLIDSIPLPGHSRYLRCFPESGLFSTSEEATASTIVISGELEFKIG
jgi:hypothetical protein